jgi:hypothetical protein
MTWLVVEKIVVVVLVGISALYISFLIYKAVSGKNKKYGCADCPSQKCCDENVKEHNKMRCDLPKRTTP